MTRAREDAAVAVEVCPACGGLDVAVCELGWFAVELERASEVRDPGVEFACRVCGTRWF